jgi:hypothetical protein
MRTKPSSEPSRVQSATTGRNVGEILTIRGGRDFPESRVSFGGQTARRGRPMMEALIAAAHLRPRSPQGDI